MKKALIVALLFLVVIVGCSNVQEQTPEEPIEEIDAGDIKEPVEEVPPVEETLVEDTEIAEPLDEVPEKPAEEVVEETAELAVDDTTDDCNLLTTKDIKSVCGVDTTKEVGEANPGSGIVCKTSFMTDDPTMGASISYSGGYNPTPEVIETLMSSCEDKVDEYTCFNEAAGKSVVVHGKKWKIVISNYLPMEDYFVCSREQLKELGALVSQRVYG